jgi:hypothetical protein
MSWVESWILRSKISWDWQLKGQLPSPLHFNCNTLYSYYCTLWKINRGTAPFCRGLNWPKHTPSAHSPGKPHSQNDYLTFQSRSESSFFVAVWYLPTVCWLQFYGSVTFSYGSGSESAEPYHWITDLDPALLFSGFIRRCRPTIFFSDFFAYYSLQVHLHQSSKILSDSEVTRHVEIKVFLIFCLFMEVSGSGSIQIITDPDLWGPKTYESGSEFRRRTFGLVFFQVYPRKTITVSVGIRVNFLCTYR